MNLLRAFGVLFLFTLGVFAQLAPRQNYTSDTTQQPSRRPLRMMQASSQKIGWVFTGVSFTNSNTVTFTYAPSGRAWAKTVTGVVESVSNVLIALSPADINTNTLSGIMDYVLEVRNDTQTLAFAAGDLTILENVSATAAGPLVVYSNTLMSGDVTGLVTNNMMTRLRGRPVAVSTNPTINDVISYDGTNWTSRSPSLGTETDPYWAASASHGISTVDTNAWTQAYWWGNHATNGYITGSVLTNSLSTRIASSSGTGTSLTVAGTLYLSDIQLVPLRWYLGGGYWGTLQPTGNAIDNTDFIWSLPDRSGELALSGDWDDDVDSKLTRIGGVGSNLLSQTRMTVIGSWNSGAMPELDLALANTGTNPIYHTIIKPTSTYADDDYTITIPNKSGSMMVNNGVDPIPVPSPTGGSYTNPLAAVNWLTLTQLTAQGSVPLPPPAAESDPVATAAGYQTGYQVSNIVNASIAAALPATETLFLTRTNSPTVSGSYSCTGTAFNISPTNTFITIGTVTNGQYIARFVEPPVVRTGRWISAGSTWSINTRMNRVGPGTLPVQWELYAVSENGSLTNSDILIDSSVEQLSLTLTDYGANWTSITNMWLPENYRFQFNLKAVGVVGTPGFLMALEGPKETPASHLHYSIGSGLGSTSDGGATNLTGTGISATYDAGTRTFTATVTASGGGGSVTTEVWNLWADSVPIYATNGPAREAYTNLWDGQVHRVLAFDKDRVEPAGPDERILPANASSNLIFTASGYTAGNTNLTLAFGMSYYQPCAGVGATNYSGTFTIGQNGCGGAAATQQAMQWTTTLSNCVPGRPIWYNIWVQPTNAAQGVTTRDADWRVEYMKLEAVCK